MKPSHKYLLRSRMNGANYYLERISEDGLRVTFTRVRDDARQFTRNKIDEFRQAYPHVVGRVVLL